MFKGKKQARYAFDQKTATFGSIVARGRDHFFTATRWGGAELVFGQSSVGKYGIRLDREGALQTSGFERLQNQAYRAMKVCSGRQAQRALPTKLNAFDVTSTHRAAVRDG